MWLSQTITQLLNNNYDRNQKTWRQRTSLPREPADSPQLPCPFQPSQAGAVFVFFAYNFCPARVHVKPRSPFEPSPPCGQCLSRWKPRAHLNVIWLSWRVERQIQFASLETRFQNEIKEDRLYKSCPLKIYLHILVQLSKSKMERWEALFIVAVSSTMGFCFHSTDV